MQKTQEPSGGLGGGYLSQPPIGQGLWPQRIVIIVMIVIVVTLVTIVTTVIIVIMVITVRLVHLGLWSLGSSLVGCIPSLGVSWEVPQPHTAAVSSQRTSKLTAVPPNFLPVKP